MQPYASAMSQGWKACFLQLRAAILDPSARPSNVSIRKSLVPGAFTPYGGGKVWKLAMESNCN